MAMMEVRMVTVGGGGWWDGGGWSEKGGRVANTRWQMCAQMRQGGGAAWGRSSAGGVNFRPGFAKYCVPYLLKQVGTHVFGHAKWRNYSAVSATKNSN